ncbi:Voltage-dependent L-type calcium channel subunit [Quillaja saponaria]|uniref:Voltage-dependent L-type calcium channel subunit n=1 Tax=Quillaja saponaria TaxID=32244 RepID=A0AAD7LN63_QUISA|nr:Voltage-dependent L-type calcium channel subunit [Quillaja saponaria]
MAESYGTERTNGVYVEVAEEDETSKRTKIRRSSDQELTLYAVLNRLITAILFPEPGNSGPLLHRIKISVSENVPLVPEASRNTGRDVLLWTRRGSSLRALLVISVGTITLVSLTGLVVFMLFFLAATINAIIISLIVSLAAAGGFLALFFAGVAAIYIGALSVAFFVISAAIFWTVIAILITTGWIGFFWIVWLATKKSVGVAKHSLTATGSAISTYASARQARNLLRTASD